MANPVLSRGFSDEDLRPGYAAADAGLATSAGYGGQPVRAEGRMTMGNAVAATAACFVVLLAGAAIGWNQVQVNATGTFTWPWWLWIVSLAGLGLVILAAFKPRLAPIVAPVYSFAQGIVVGAVSHLYEWWYDGIVLQAALATIAVFLVTLVLYAARVVKVTNKFIMGVVAATFGVALLYLFGFLLSLFGIEVGFLYGSGWFSIGVSIIIVGIAALNLMIDFWVVEEGAKAGAPSYMAWYAALGLMVTIIWLYFEMLRLLAKLRN